MNVLAWYRYCCGLLLSADGTAEQIRYRRCRWALLVSLLLAGCTRGSIAAAGEPAEAFLARLRAAGYYDVALLYLDRLDRFPGVPAELLQATDLERAQTYLEAAGAARSAQQRDEHFIAAEAALQAFLKTASAHPRQPEARLQLGNLQMVRGAVLMESADLDDATRQRARQSLQAAAATFDAIVDRLRAELESMQGERINAQQQPEKAALRDRYRVEYMQAKLRGAEARQRAAETYAQPGVGGKRLLEEALERFTELSEKYGDYLPGALAMLHRAQVQRMLGQNPAALDSFQRVLEEREADALRIAKISALAGAIELWLSSQPPKIQPAIDRGQAWVDAARPEEKQSREFQQLRLQLAKAYLAKAADESAKPADQQRARTAARQSLLAASRLPGSHQPEARQLLAQLGVEKPTSAPATEYVQPKSLQEAVTAARGLIELSDQLEQSAALLKKQQDDPAADAEAITRELQSIETQQVQSRQQAIEILRSGLTLAGRSADPVLLNQARQFLAYMLYRSDRLREAAVVGGFLARTAPGNDDGLRGGLLALSSLQTLLQQIDADAQAGVLAQIESLGTFLVKHWPGDPQVSAARGMLIRIALSQDRWSEARAMLDATPDDSPDKAEFQRLMGQLMWNRYLTLMQQGQAADEAAQLLTQAGADLRQGLSPLTADQVTSTDLQAALILAKIRLRQEQPQQALDVLDNPQYGPLVRLGKIDPPYANFPADVYSAALQAVVGQLIGAGGDNEQLLDRAAQMMDRLRQAAAGQSDAQARLVQNYISLARDIREQIDGAPPGRKSELIAAFRLFLSRVADQSDDADSLQWVAQTLSEMGQSAMDDANQPAQGQAAELLESAATTFGSLIEKSNDPEKLLAMRFQLSRVQRLRGEYKQAIDELEAVLREKPMMLDAQVEAAKTYQQWAPRTQYTVKAYEFALYGSRPDPKTQKNIIWGWGKISQLTSGNPQFRDVFFDARYQIALCRFLMGKAAKDQRIIEQSAKDISQVAAMYPDLGTPQTRQKFDVLLREIQRSLGQRDNGLEAVQSTTAVQSTP